MRDAVRATLQLMAAPADQVTLRMGYNLGGLSCSAAEIAAEITKLHPSFTVTYSPDYRQAIADSWPSGIDDSQARQDWNWAPQDTLELMSQDMYENLKIKLKK
jgi:nucleoside-diphosphate-sugar epimerase